MDTVFDDALKNDSSHYSMCPFTYYYRPGKSAKPF